jgi:hypothetical protein
VEPDPLAQFEDPARRILRILFPRGGKVASPRSATEGCARGTQPPGAGPNPRDLTASGAAPSRPALAAHLRKDLQNPWTTVLVEKQMRLRVPELP